MIDFTIERTVRAPVQTVFDRLTDHRAYASMTPLRRSELEREGTPAPNGVGAVRRLVAAGPPLREEVTVYEPPHRFAYRMLSGLPVRDYVGTVELREVPEGTHMHYHVRAQATIPGTAAALGAVVKVVIGQLSGAIAKRAERG